MTLAILLILSWHTIKWDPCVRPGLDGYILRFDYDRDGQTDEEFTVPCYDVYHPDTGVWLYRECPTKTATPRVHSDGTLQSDHANATVSVCPYFTDGSVGGDCGTADGHNGGPTMTLGGWRGEQ